MSIDASFLEALLILPISLLAFAVLLIIIVFFHEYGHFSVARLLGVRVDIFSIGFGKPIAKWVDRKGTEWRISWLPLGGYVKFFGDVNAASQAPKEAAQKPVTTQFPGPRDAEEIAAGGMTAEERKVCFHFKPLWRRAAIVAAGPFANFLLAVVIFSALFMIFGRPVPPPAVIGEVTVASAAEEGGLQAGDRILAVNGRKIDSFGPIYDIVLLSGGDRIDFRILRGAEEIDVPVTPRRVSTQDRYGNAIDVWQLGIRPEAVAVTFKTYGPFAAVREGFVELQRILTMTVRFLGQLVLGKEDVKQLGGPIKMATYAGQSVMSGFDDSSYAEPPGFLLKLRVSVVDFIFLAAVVSVSIGFLNLLPIPVLDGGHLLYYAYEAVAGRPLGARAQAFGFRLGIVLLASLMIFVTWNDINNLLSSIS